METVFDIATPAELVNLFGDEKYPEDKELFDHERQLVQKSPDVNFGLLAQLYALRGEENRAEQFLTLIKDDQMRLDYMLLLNDLDMIDTIS